MRLFIQTFFFKNDDTISIKDVNTGGVNVYLYYQIGQDTLPVNVTDTILGPASPFSDIDILKKTLPFGKLIVTGKKKFFLDLIFPYKYIFLLSKKNLYIYILTSNI